MKKLLIISALFCVSAVPASAGITLGTACTPASATSCTLLATPAFGDLMIGMGYNGTSATAVTTPTGWLSVKSVTGNTNAINLTWKYSVGNETTCGVMTNATKTYCQVYKGAWITAGTLGGAFGNNASSITETTASVIISYVTFTLTNPLSTSWVVCGGGASGATAGADVAPSGMTLRSGTTVPTIAFSDTNGNVTTWSTTNVTYTTASHSASACFELVGSPALTSAVGSNLATNVFAGSAHEPCTGACTLVLQMPPTLTNNYLHVTFAWGYATTAPTVSNIYCNADTGHATWTFTLEKSVLDTGDTTDMFSYGMAGAPSGCTSISVVASSVWNEAIGWYDQFYGIPLTAAVDATAGTNFSGTAPYLSPGAITPTQAGDVIVDHCTSATISGTVSTNVFNSTGVMTLPGVSVFDSIMSSLFVETGSGALTINHLATGFTGNGICIATALKTDVTKGTAPSGVYPLSIVNLNMGNAASQTFQYHNLAAGNAFLLHLDASETATQTQWTAISDVLGDSLTSHQPTDANGGYPNWALDCSQLAGDNFITIAYSRNPITPQIYIMEIAGVDNSSHTACYDATAGTPVAFAATGTSPTPMPTITPSTSGGIVIAASEMGTGVPHMALQTPSGGVFMVATYTGQSDVSGMGLGNMFGYKINTSTSAMAWQWGNGTSTNWNASAIALKAPAATGGCSNSIFLMGAGCR